MGNCPSQDGGGSSGGGGLNLHINNRLGRLRGQSNALGLSKNELDDRCRPSGLYPSCHWEEKVIRRLIGDGKLAARLKGAEKRAVETDQECPICFLFYTEVNLTKCCQAVLCTECYLQVRPQREKASTCPFCNNPKLMVQIAKKLEEEDIQERHREERRMEQSRAQEKAAAAAYRHHPPTTPQQQPSASTTVTTTDAAAAAAPQESALPCTPNQTKSVFRPGAGDDDDANGGDEKGPQKGSYTRHTSLPGGFGSSLEQSPQVALLRARSSSLSEKGGGNRHQHRRSDSPPIAALAVMSPADRRALEAEMKAQHSHPLSQRLQREEEERRLQNELEYYRNMIANRTATASRTSSLIRMHHGAAGSGDDDSSTASLTPPAAIATNTNSSRRQTSSRGSSARRDWNRIVDAFESAGHGSVQTLDDLVVLEAAIMLSMEEEERRRTTGTGGSSSLGGSSDDSFDAAQHASRGFPLARARVQQQHSSQNQQQRAGGGGTSADMRSSAPALLSTADLIMRGMSEEEQLAMAIAASLEETQQRSSGAAAAAGGGAATESTTASL